MNHIKKPTPALLMAMLGILLFCAINAVAYEINDKLSIGGIIAGEWQYQDLSDAEGFESEGRGAMVFQPEISFTPTGSDEVFALFPTTNLPSS